MRTFNALKTTTLAVVAVMTTLAIAPIAARADGQNDKNNWRNGAIAGGAVTLYGLANHQHTTTLLGAAGTAYSLSRYEKARHRQSVESSARARYHRHHHRHHRYHA